MKKKVNSGKAHHIIKHKNIKFKKRIFTKPKTIHHTFNNLFGTNLIENIKEEFTPQKKPEISKYEPPKENKKHNFFSFLKQKDQKHIEHKGHENKFLELFIKKDKQILDSKTIADMINCSERNAGTVMKTMQILGLGKIEEINEEYQGNGRPRNIFSLREEYFNLLKKLKELRQSHSVNLSSESSFGSDIDSV